MLAEAEAAAARSGPIDGNARVDLTELLFVMIDPPGSTDLDQALFIERLGDGYRVWYAIADVAAWVRPGGAIDLEANRRGQTFYAPTWRIPLHPAALSEGAASLLADGVARPALVWRMDLDATGHSTHTELLRGTVRSRAQLNYHAVQRDLEAGRASESLELLREVGMLREQIEIDRGGVSLNLPEQEVVAEGTEWHLVFREGLPVEAWNAQISLLTGISAAQIMLDAGVGLLRTLPPAQQYDVEKLRRIAKSLRIAWPGGMDYPDFVRSLDPTEPDDQAMLNACTLLFRGASYTVVDADLRPEQTVHGALATPYAHVTAPLRRLVDRYAGAICADLLAGREPAAWAVAELDELPKRMRDSDQRAKKFERGIIDHVEALVLSGRVGQRFEGMIIDIDDRRPERGVASIPPVAVEAPVTGRHSSVATRCCCDWRPPTWPTDASTSSRRAPGVNCPVGRVGRVIAAQAEESPDSTGQGGGNAHPG